MNTYPGKQSAGGMPEGTREWVFGLLGQPRYRERCEQLEGLELRRRPDCEPCLRSLVTEEWTPETEHHMGWCDSCRIAGFALGTAALGTAAAGIGPAPRRRRAVLLALAAGLVIAAPLLGSSLLDDPLGQQPRGGLATKAPIKAPIKEPLVVRVVPRSKPVKKVVVVRHKRSAGVKRSERAPRALPHTT